mgnify:CR=1 FL=1
MSRHGMLLVLSSPSGGGKTTLARLLLRTHGDLRFSVSHTTRRPRRGEHDGVDYHFVAEADFNVMVERDAFAEWCVVHGNRYGTSAQPLAEAVADGRDVVLELDNHGAEKLRARFPAETLLVYVLPPSMQVLEQRLRSRGTDSETVISRRLARAPDELRHHGGYHYRVVNDLLDAAFADLDALFMHERARRAQHPIPAHLAEVAARCAGQETCAPVLTALGLRGAS